MEQCTSKRKRERIRTLASMEMEGRRVKERLPAWDERWNRDLFLPGWEEVG